jgi:hypothetical protein
MKDLVTSIKGPKLFAWLKPSGCDTASDWPGRVINTGEGGPFASAPRSMGRDWGHNASSNVQASLSFACLPCLCACVAFQPLFVLLTLVAKTTHAHDRPPDDH